MTQFSQRIIDWQKLHGRHDLPWQNTIDPYAIWVSEIMLQQTQVTAVIGYYAKFMQRFPSIKILAAATQEEVLQYWSGLGYYSRARNLHAAAQKIMDDFNGVFPSHFDDIQSLSGIGRSTAAAISTFALNLPQPILDGNVKRVFARHFNVSGYTGAPKVAQQLWQIAERENPNDANKESDAIAYTQGLMDLGATLCTRTKPRCTICPVNHSCEALALNLVKSLPTPKPRKTIPEKSVTMLVLIHQNTVMLEKRPPSGIWGGLWSLPEVTEGANIDGVTLQNSSALKPLTHVFTHFKLHITPQLIYIDQLIPQVNQAVKIWLPLEEAIAAAIPTPIRTILMSINALTNKNA
ncbi:A/G-specific adenine glycosylase [Methylotenera versatilis]|uniref:A/G-specific adenine glycosylase n=1 Tax=Methylotenera versatilis TaxID=1055487 RepID=UPI000646F9FD|nr:A/G-specific adenine glycosylase [Methylotenera versatilis]